MKLLILAIDGLDFQFLRRWEYPMLKQWRDHARWGIMWSAEKRTGPSWTTIMTGWTCGHHGVTTLFGVKVAVPPEGKKPPPWGYVPSTAFRDRPHDYIFDVCWDHGLKAGAVNMPGLPNPRAEEGLPKTAQGFLVGGWPYRPWVRPSSLDVGNSYYTGEADAADRCPEILALKPPGAGLGWELHVWQFAEWAQWIDRQDRYKIDEAARLAKQVGGLDVLMLCTQMWDRGGHMLCSKNQGPGMGALDPRLYDVLGPVLDQWVGKAIQTFSPEMIAICSDHGFGQFGHTHLGVWGISGTEHQAGRHNMIDQADFAPTVLRPLGIKMGFGLPLRRDGFCRLMEKGDNAELAYEYGGEMMGGDEDDEAIQRRTLAALGYLGEEEAR